MALVIRVIRVSLACAYAARQVFEQSLALPPGTTAAQAVEASALPERLAQWQGPDWHTFTPGVWGRAVAWSHALRDGDRLELCRSLQVDPKMARRERFRQQGARGTGLFARRRPGGKAGY